MTENDTAPMEMIVRMLVKPWRVDVVLERLNVIVEQTRGEDGTLEFVVYTTDKPGEIWLKETYVSQAYHDGVHEGTPEIKALLEWLPGEITEPWTIATVRRVLER
jgi:quinol monooxygenase YgiN